MLIKKIKTYYKLLLRKKIDNFLILIGSMGVIIGLFFEVEIINQIFAWAILCGACLKLYEFTNKIQRDAIPYDFNRLLPPPKK